MRLTLWETPPLSSTNSHNNIHREDLVSPAGVHYTTTAAAPSITPTATSGGAAAAASNGAVTAALGGAAAVPVSVSAATVCGTAANVAAADG